LRRIAPNCAELRGAPEDEQRERDDADDGANRDAGDRTAGESRRRDVRRPNGRRRHRRRWCPGRRRVGAAARLAAPRLAAAAAILERTIDVVVRRNEHREAREREGREAVVGRLHRGGCAARRMPLFERQKLAHKAGASREPP
jgi:hypothetical protein